MPSSGHYDGPSDQYRESAVRVAIKNFSPVWFVMSMDTGIISIIINLHPWRFSGQGVLSTIMFVWNLALFLAFTLIALTRLFLYPRHVKSESINKVEEMSYLAAPSIAYLTLVSQVALTCSTAWGYGLTVFAYVLWWIGLVWTVSTCSGVTIQLARRNISDDRSLSPAIFLPLIAVMTQGTTGGLIVNYSVGITSAEAIPIIVVSYMLIGYAFCLAILYYAMYLHRLLAVGPPQEPKIPSLVILVGPCGQFATAIQLLGAAAYTRGHFAAYNQGTFLTATAASTVSTVSTILALLVDGFAFLWIAIAWYLFVEALTKGRISFGLTWWSLIFPMGVFTTSLLNLSVAMNSPAFRGLVSALLIFLLIIYFFNLGFSVYRIYTGVALGVPQQREEEKQHEQEEREKKKQRERDGRQPEDNV